MAQLLDLVEDLVLIIRSDLVLCTVRQFPDLSGLQCPVNPKPHRAFARMQ